MLTEVHPGGVSLSGLEGGRTKGSWTTSCVARHSEDSEALCFRDCHVGFNPSIVDSDIDLRPLAAWHKFLQPSDGASFTLASLCQNRTKVAPDAI